MFKKSTHRFVSLLLIIIVSSCATYYDKSRATERQLIAGNYDDAQKKIGANKFLAKKRNALLFNLEMGKVLHLQNKFEESNRYLNEADRLMEQYRNGFETAVGITVNPSLQPYIAEPHEQIMMHYYKILNYVQLGKMEDAIVEVRRLNEKEKALDIASNSNEKKYSQDPFGLMLMGLIYEADGNDNDAFIAYRNAKLSYDNDQTGLYQNNEPTSLEQALLRTANNSGIAYESKEKYDLNYAPHGELILFYESGLSPVKAEKNYFFSLSENAAGFFFQSGTIIVPVVYNFKGNNPNFNPASLGFIRLAFPYYVSRSSVQKNNSVSVNGETKTLELIEDISALAFQIEQDNFFKNLGRDLLRLTIKKIAELSLAQKNEYLGTALNIANTVTEKADTRNWQTLPSQIQFLRVPLKEGTNTIQLKTNDGKSTSFEIIGNGKMIFKNICEF